MSYSNIKLKYSENQQKYEEDCKIQAITLLNYFREKVKNNPAIIIGITYSANYGQTERIKKCNKENKLPTISGANQANVMNYMLTLLNADYSDLQTRVKIIPITTMSYPSKRRCKKIVDEDYQDAINFANQPNHDLVIWGNQDDQVAIGGGIVSSNNIPSAVEKVKKNFLTILKENNIKPVELKKTNKKILKDESELMTSETSSDDEDETLDKTFVNPEKIFNPEEIFVNPDLEYLKKIIKSKLNKYMKKIESHKKDNITINYKYGFWFYKSSRAYNREGNYKTAKALINKLNQCNTTDDLLLVFKSANIKKIRSDIMKDINCKHHKLYKRGIHSADLNKAIKHSQKSIKNLGKN